MKKKTVNLAQDVLPEEAESGLCAYILCAPTAHACRQACEHLRYWPYVKEFHPMNRSGGRILKVHVLIGKGMNNEEFWKAVDRATELMNRCLRQYQCVMVDWGEVILFEPFYKPEMFLRPDSLNMPFISFLKELDSSKPHNLLTS